MVEKVLGITNLISLSACFVWSGNLARGASSVVQSGVDSVMLRCARALESLYSGDSDDPSPHQ